MITLQVPDVLGGHPQDTEQFYMRLESLPHANRYVLDMRLIGFVRPYGATALVMAARYLSHLSGCPVLLQQLAPPMHLYLKRMNFLTIGSKWLQVATALDEAWARNPQTRNLLELTLVRGSADVNTVTSRAEQIFAQWIADPYLGYLISMLSELCSNIYQHSGDSQGGILIQKYEAVTQGQAVICFAVGDQGCGIRASLQARYGQIAQTPFEYLREALHGRSARPTGRGGLGLRLVEQIAESTGGYLWLRSENAAILSRGPGKTQGWSDLTHVMGTQVAVELRAPLIP